MTDDRRRVWLALLGSFGVYCIPLVGPHAAVFLGEALVATVSGNRSAGWIAANMSLAVASQTAAGLALYWSLGGRWTRKIIWVGIIPLTITLNVAYLSVIPVRKVTAASGAAETDIDLAHIGPGSYVLLDVDAEAREVLLWRDDGPIIVTFDGQLRPLRFEPRDIRAQSSTYIRVGDGWVAWDAYKEEGPYQIGWSLSRGSGRHWTNAGRSVTSAAVDPTASYIRRRLPRLFRSRRHPRP